jgi:NAD(P)-dependent dehydrogenase (short-subunit alcohol dehydrogenase family)
MTDDEVAPTTADRVALVTGAASGIGRATAVELAERGATVVVTDVDAACGRTVAAAIREAGGDASFRELDVTDLEAFESVVAEVASARGSLDVLVNNAGVLGPEADLESVSPAERDHLVAVNVEGTWNGCRAALPEMKSRGGGAIVNVSSVTALRGSPAHATYSLTKGAIAAFTRALAGEAGPHGVRVNAVCPGVVDTDLQSRRSTDLDAAAETHALGRVGTPEEIATCIAFLAGDDASFVTGHALVADGGYATVL